MSFPWLPAPPQALAAARSAAGGTCAPTPPLQGASRDSTAAAGSARDRLFCEMILAALALAAAGPVRSSQHKGAAEGGGGGCDGEAALGQASVGGARDPGVWALSLCELAMACGRGASDWLLQRVQGLFKVRGSEG